MRIALIADIHANLPALRATLERLHRLKVEHIICLGDVAGTGPNPHECLTVLRQTNCPVVMGNVDAFMLDRPDPSGPDDVWHDIDSWCAEQLTDDDLDYIRTFEPTLTVSESIDMLCYHGSPHDMNDEIVVTTPEDHLEAYFGEPAATIYAGGHTHQPFMRRYRNAWLINPGSVGLGYHLTADGSGAVNPAEASFVLLEIIRKQPQITFQRVRYDVRAYIASVRQSGMPHAEWFLSGRL